MFRKVQLKFFGIITSILLAIFIAVLGSVNIIMDTVMEHQTQIVLEQVAAGVGYDGVANQFYIERPDDENWQRFGDYQRIEPPSEPAIKPSDSATTQTEETTSEVQTSEEIPPTTTAVQTEAEILPPQTAAPTEEHGLRKLSLHGQKPPVRPLSSPLRPPRRGALSQLRLNLRRLSRLRLIRPRRSPRRLSRLRLSRMRLRLSRTGTAVSLYGVRGGRGIRG